MDPDDLLVNPDLLKTLYNYNLIYNLDIIEFSVLHYNEKNNVLYLNPKKNHFHNFTKNIIFQPDLSDLYFYIPRTKNYSSVICTSIWNKVIRKEIILKTIIYIGKDYYNYYFITAEDTLTNIVNTQFANNYSNINYPGYMYNIREKSMSHGIDNRKHQILFNYNYLLYNKKLYMIIKDFNKDRNFLFFNLLGTNFLLLQLKKIDKEKYTEINEFYQDILKDKNISNIFKKYLNKSLYN